MTDWLTKTLADFTGGIHNRNANPLIAPDNSLVDGENAILALGGIATRPGSSVTHPNTTAPTSTIVAATQFVCPTNEITYMVVQEHGTADLSWTAIANGPARARHSIVWDTGNGRALLFGGEATGGGYLNDLRSYDPDTDTWTTLSPTGTPPTARKGHAAIYVPALEAMYVIGGYDITGNLMDVHKLDCTTDAWSEITDGGTIPAARWGHAACLIGTNTIMISGGKGTSYYDGHVYYDLNLTTNNWTEVTATTGGSSMGHRYLHSLVYDGSQYCYSTGGNIDDETYTKTNWKINRTAGTYSSLTDCPHSDGIAAHIGFYCAGYVVVIGGRSALVTIYNNAYQVYSCTTNTWVTVAPDGDIGARFALAGCVTDTGLTIVHGGISETDPTDVYEATGYSSTSLCASGVGDGTYGAFNLYASNTNLPTTTQVYENIYTLGSTAGVCEFATLGDRLLITEGQFAVPLVFLPGTLSTDTVDDYASPMRVILDYGAQNYHDVSDNVLDNDLDSVADIGGITTKGVMYIVCDVQTVKKFYFEFETPNNVAGATTEFSETLTVDAVAKINRADVKGVILTWVKDGAATGHFESTHKIMAGAAVDLGGAPNTVKIPCVGHGFVVGDVITIANTGVNYDGIHTLPSQAAGDVDNFVITLAYNAQVFADPDYAAKHIGTGQEDIESGQIVDFADATPTIASITGDGTGTNGITLLADHVSASITAIYGVTVNDASVLTLTGADDTTDTLFDKSATLTGYWLLPNTGIMRFVVPAADLSTTATHIKLTLASYASDVFLAGYTIPRQINNGCSITHVSIVERSGTTTNGTTTPTEVTFNNGAQAVAIAKGGTVTSDLIPFVIDNTKDYLVTIQGSGDTGTYSVFVAKTYPTTDTHRLFYGDTSSNAYNQAAFTPYSFGYYYVDTAVTIALGTSSVSPPALLYTATTNDTSQISLAGVDSIRSVVVTASQPGASNIYYAVSWDDRNTYKVFTDAAWRSIARFNGTNWFYNNSATSAENWVDFGSNEPELCLAEALATSQNQMTETEFEAISETDWAAAIGNPTLDFMFGLELDAGDSDNVPTLTSVVVNTYDTGGSECEGWLNGAWSPGVGWTDNTIAGGVAFGQNGTIVYDNAAGFTADYGVIAGIPGYIYRLSIRGTSAGTTLTKVRYQAPCQALQSIGDGQPDTLLGFVFHDVSAGNILDYTVEMSDNTYTSTASAEISMKTTDYIYIGYLTRFNEVRMLFGATNNNVASVLTLQYWDGLDWVDLTITDGTSEDAKTFRKQGNIKFTEPDDWKTSIPVEGMTYFNTESGKMEIGYWLRASVSVNLTASVVFAECRVSPVPGELPKHKHVAVFQNRAVLANQPSATDQMLVSAPFSEYVWSGQNSASYRGGSGSIHALLDAWNTLLAAHPDRWTLLTGVTGSEQDMVPVGASRHIPINTRVIVKAPMSGSDDGSRDALFFLNRWGAYAVTGLQADSNFATARAQVLSDGVNWWDSASTPRLDKDYLHLACGVYWPERNWVIWAVPMITTGSSQSTNNRLLVFDLSIGAWLPPFTIAASALWTAYHYNASAPGKLGELGLYAGNYSGEISRLFAPDATDDAGTDISAWIETPWMHFGSPDAFKWLRLLKLYATTEGDGITFTVYTDGGEVAAFTEVITDFSALVDQEFKVKDGEKNVKGNFYKFRLDFTGPTSIHGITLRYPEVQDVD